MRGQTTLQRIEALAKRLNFAGIIGNPEIAAQVEKVEKTTFHALFLENSPSLIRSRSKKAPGIIKKLESIFNESIIYDESLSKAENISLKNLSNIEIAEKNLRAAMILLEKAAAIDLKTEATKIIGEISDEAKKDPDLAMLSQELQRFIQGDFEKYLESLRNNQAKFAASPVDLKTGRPVAPKPGQANFSSIRPVEITTCDLEHGVSLIDSLDHDRDNNLITQRSHKYAMEALKDAFEAWHGAGSFETLLEFKQEKAAAAQKPQKPGKLAPKSGDKPGLAMFSSSEGGTSSPKPSNIVDDLSNAFGGRVERSGGENPKPPKPNTNIDKPKHGTGHYKSSLAARLAGENEREKGQKR